MTELATRPSTLSVLIADDHALVRETIAHYLREGGDVTVDSASDLPEALLKMSSEPYDIVLLDLQMPGMDGLHGLEAAIEKADGAAVVVLTGTQSMDLARRAIAMGARGYIPKTLAARSLVNAIHFIASGEVYMPMKMMEAPQVPVAAGGVKLTTQEHRVLSALCDGRANKEIARDMDLKEVTIKMHMRSICRKLGARNRTHAALIARTMSLVNT